QEELRKLVNQHKDQGIVSPCDSPWNNPVLLVKKADGTMRYVLDLRRFNPNVIKNTYPLPIPQDQFDRLHGARWFIS
ncbi:unnamed protein product, partial [Allacma fusca]